MCAVILKIVKKKPFKKNMCCYLVFILFTFKLFIKFPFTILVYDFIIIFLSHDRILLIFM